MEILRKAKYDPQNITTIYEQKVPRSFQEATRKKLTRRSLSLITNINNAMRDRIREVLREGVREGKSVSAVASSLLTTGLDKGVFASARKRAYLVARTELHRARQKGAVDIYKHNKISQVQWVVISDGRICDRCQGRAGRVYRVKDLVEEDFPPIHPRCRCRLLPTDFQVSIKVKQTDAGKVMETKVYPSPQNYKYVIKVKKSLDLEKAKRVQVKPYQRKGKYVIGYGRLDPREKIGDTYITGRPTDVYRKDLTENGWTEVSNGLFKDSEHFPGHSFQIYGNGSWVHEWPSYRHYGEQKKGKDYASFVTRLKNIQKMRLSVELNVEKQPWEMTREEFQEGLIYLGPMSVAKGDRLAGVASSVQLSEIAEAGKLGLSLVKLSDGRIVYGKTAADAEALAKDLQSGMKDPELSRRLGYTDKDWQDLVAHGYEAHKGIILNALSEGKPVPHSVLKDYPDLKFDPRDKKVLYHGTYEKFDRFLPPDEVPEEVYNPAQHAIGVYATESEEFARTFGDKVVKVAKPEKTLDLTNAKTFDDFVALLPIDKEANSFALKRMKIDSMWGDEEIDMQYKLIEDFDNKFGIVEKLKGQGYDSLSFKEEHNNKKANTVVIFDAEKAKIVKSLDIDEKELSREVKKVDTSPTEAEKESGTYQKGHIDIGGLDVSIENPKGSYRSGVSKNGKEWKTQLHSHYGYILGTKGKDKDHLDVFLGDNLDSDKVFVVNQIDPKTKEFDEHKVMIGFSNEEDAKKGYLANYEKGWTGISSIVEKTFDEFKEWATGGHTTTKLEKALGRIDSLLKAVQVKGFTRTRKGKMEIVKPFSRDQAVKEVERLRAKEPIEVGGKLFKQSDRSKKWKEEVVLVDVSKFDADWSKDEEYYVSSAGKGAIGRRIENFKDFLETGEPIEMPEVSARSEEFTSRVGFTNGRHRFAVLRDLGFKVIPVSVDKKSVKVIKDLFGTKIETVPDVQEPESFEVELGTAVREENSARHKVEDTNADSYPITEEKKEALKALRVASDHTDSLIEKNFNLALFKAEFDQHGLTDRTEALKYVIQSIRLINEKMNFDGKGILKVICTDLVSSEKGVLAEYFNDDVSIKINKKYENTLGHEYAHFLFSKSIIEGTTYPIANFDSILPPDPNAVIAVDGASVASYFEKLESNFSLKQASKEPFLELLNSLKELYSKKVPDATFTPKSFKYFLDVNEMFARAVEAYIDGEPGIVSSGKFRVIEGNEEYYQLAKTWGDKYLKTGIVKSLDFYHRTRFGKQELVRKPRSWKVTFADGSHAEIRAKSSMEAVQEGKKLSKLTIQRTEDLGEVKEELEKAIQVKGFIRTRKGKLERVKPYSREGEPFTVEHMLPTQEAIKTGEKLSRQEALDIWDEYKRITATPYPEDLKEFEARAFRTQTLREIVEGYLGSEEALTPYEIDEMLGIGYPFSVGVSPEQKIEKQLNPERSDVKLALDVINDITDAGGRAMIVGGFVRDALLGKPSKDLDIEVYSISPDKLKSILEKRGEVAQVGKSFGVFIFKSPELSEAIDVSLPRRESKTGKGHKGFMVEPDSTMTPKEAAKRRDLTINSMGYDPNKKEFIDPYEGQQDLKNKILRAVDKETFGDDPLRVLRVMRFAGNLGFTIDPELVDICKGLSDSLEELPKERIYGEMEKLLLKSKKPSLGIQTIPLLGIKLFPELTDMIGVEQDDLWHPEGDVWTHTLMAVDDAAKKKEQFADNKDKMIYMLASLLHDVGKPKTPGLNEKGRITHRKHSEVGAQIAVEFMKKRLTDEDVVLSKVENLIRYHMTPTEYYKARINDSAIRKLARKLDIPMLVAVSSADKQGRGPSLRNKLSAERWLMKRYHALGLDKPEALKPIVMGRHLIELGIQPGPFMGKILNELYESQLSGRFDTVESGIDFARRVGLLEPIQKGFYVGRNMAMKQLLELRKSKNDGKLIPMKDNGKVRWFKSFGKDGLWRKVKGTPIAGSTILIKGKLSSVTAIGKDGVTARERESGNKYKVLYKDVELMKSI